MEKTPDRDVESHLRQSIGREWQEEAAEDEMLTELLRKRRSISRDESSSWFIVGSVFAQR